MTWLLDALLNWLLWLPLDVVLVLVALGTALILTVVRLKTTNQDLLHRCRADKTRLQALIRQAKRTGDIDAVARHRASSAQIGLKTLRAELLPLLASLLPIAALAIWSYAHLAYHPPRVEEPLTVHAWFTPAAIGEPVFLAPADGLHLPTAESSIASASWLRRIATADQREAFVASPQSLISRPHVEEASPALANRSSSGGVPRGVASWTIIADASPELRMFAVRHRGRTYQLPVLIGQRSYAAPDVTFADGPLRKLEVELRPYRPFGIVPGYAPLGLEPWLIGYLLLAAPAAFALRRLMHVC